MGGVTFCVLNLNSIPTSGKTSEIGVVELWGSGPEFVQIEDIYLHCS